MAQTFLSPILASGCCNSPADISLDKYDKDFNGKFYKPWYSSRFKNIQELVTYWAGEYTALREKSELFKSAFYASTLPTEVLEAILAMKTHLITHLVTDGDTSHISGCCGRVGARGLGLSQGRS